MKYQVGKFVAKITSHGLHEEFFFMKVIAKNGQHYLIIDDGYAKLIDEDVRDFILQDVHMIRPLGSSQVPKFKNVKWTITAESEFGTPHEWTRTSWEGLENLLRKFPGLIDAYATDSARAEWLKIFVVRARELKPKKV